ncbi:hypothetical protein [uncultured Hyphomicrobium sp.]|uniref:hypothetical protein n=1 Tax=uncultured Hyphomicrobium sp. TaxID=194373 RepID=UPI0025DE9C67|nr:hypothetical protein [uncultured Hyphomicrobium sp.]
MSLMTRAVTAFAVLSVAAIPVAALTIKNTSSKEISVGVDNGTEEAVYQIPSGGSVDVKQDCSSDCAVTGPWGYSRLVAQDATIETDGLPIVTVAATAESQSLVPQNPVAEAADGTEAATTETEAKPAPVVRKRTAKSRKPATVKQAQKGPASGSFQMLFQGPGK